MKDITNIEVGFASPCNFCFDQKGDDGISWTRTNSGERYHVCNKCVEVFRRRNNGRSTYKQIYCINDGTEEIPSYLEMKEEIRNTIMGGRSPSSQARQMIENNFTEEEELMLALYAYIIKGNKIRDKKRKSMQTYIRNRLYDENVVNKLINNGSVNSMYLGTIYLEDIISWGRWSKEEMEIIDKIQKERNKLLEEHES